MSAIPMQHRRPSRCKHTIGGVLDLNALRRLSGLPPHAALTCRCGGHGHLRRCSGNNSVAWQCEHCGRALSAWLPHRALNNIEVESLPEWDTTRHYSHQGSLL
jgi:hypothetical protein